VKGARHNKAWEEHKIRVLGGAGTRRTGETENAEEGPIKSTAEKEAAA
jgi:hypothetical protein